MPGWQKAVASQTALEIYRTFYNRFITKGNIMSKAQDTKNETKKESTKTLKEKRAEKKVKQEEKKRLG